jgi:two-component system response regulator
MSTISTTSVPLILMLEHDPDDRSITRKVFEEKQYKARLEFVGDSESLFAYLAHCSQVGSDYPALLLINLYATPRDAREILKQLKTHPGYTHIPVVILSEVEDNKIARECYVLGASSFIQKPGPLNEITAKIDRFFRYWFETVVLS